MCINRLWITFILLLGSLQNSWSAWLRCYRTSLGDYDQISLDNPMAIIISSCFKASLPTVIYTFGYRGKTNGPATTAVLSSYLATKKKNLILLDWQEEADGGILGISLGYVLSAVPNAKKIGEQLGDALVNLGSGGMNMSEVHLMGHSLGAHLMAYAGRRTQERGYIVPRITGLDPARVLFESSFFYRGLDRTCAKFVDIVHSNPGDYGTSKSTGTVDVWPNFNEVGIQPGCPFGNFPKFSLDDLCSHDRSWRYIVEAIKSSTAFQAAAADNYNNWLIQNGGAQNIIYLGDLMNTRARGNYFLSTRPRPPFAMGQDGLKPDDNQIHNIEIRKKREEGSRRISESSVLKKIFNMLR